MNYELVINHLIKHAGFKNLKELVINVSGWLGISEASIYNKINGRSKFSVEELLIVCQKTNVSLVLCQDKELNKIGLSFC